MDDRAIKATVRRGLRRYWSPDQIAGRLRLLCFDEQRRVSARTIYGWIAAGEEGRRCRRFLRNRGKRGFRPKRPDPIGAPLKERPKVIEDRLRLGDFEGDTVLGPGPGGLATLVDRKSRYSVVLKIQSKQANHVQKRICRRLKQLDESRRRSVTFDHGTEFARCHRLQQHPGLELYLAEPGKPHQRGTNENTNGLIRQFFPKGTRFRKVTPQQVHRVQNLLNDRPRACLGYRTPNEVYFGDPAPKNCV
jgi:IS30 family transposase